MFLLISCFCVRNVVADIATIMTAQTIWTLQAVGADELVGQVRPEDLRVRCLLRLASC